MLNSTAPEIKSILGWGCGKCGREETEKPNIPEQKRRKSRNCDSVSSKKFMLPPSLTTDKEIGSRCPWSSIQARDKELFFLVKRIQFLGKRPLYNLPNSLVERLELVSELLTLSKEKKQNGA